jgi:hypothetical protein
VFLAVHPILGIIVVGGAFAVAALGWRSLLMRRPGTGERHARWAGVWLATLALAWLLGLLGVGLANMPGAPPAGSGHFLLATVLLVGYSMSGTLMLWLRPRPWVRPLHVAVNTLLLGLVVAHVLGGVNRLYRFGLLAPVPQDQTVRRILEIKFDLESPPPTALSSQTYTWATPSDGTAYGGDWQRDNGAILQSECGCTGNLMWDTLSTNNRFPLLAFSGPIFDDLDYAAEFRIDSGQVDQYAGLAFRIVNSDNYYVVRASASEQSMSLSRFVNGSRQVLETFPAEVRLGQWHAVAVELRGASVQFSLDGRPSGQVSDAGWLTGRVGLGTKADSIARFRTVTAIAR